MEIQKLSGFLEVSGVTELSVATRCEFFRRVAGAVDVSLSEIHLRFEPCSELDCGGISALVALQNRALALGHPLTIKILGAPPAVKRLLVLSGFAEWCTDTVDRAPSLAPTLSPLSLESSTGTSAFAN